MPQLAVSTQVAVLYAVGIFALFFAPGAVTLLKGRTGMFAVGWLVGGLVWTIVSFRLALPDSHWARWFYRQDMVSRARRRYPNAASTGIPHLLGAALMLAAPVAIGIAVAMGI
jgi:hypothetical protein